MNSNPKNLRVRILDADRKGVENATVRLLSHKKEITLYCIDQKGTYVSEESIPKGTYEIIVSKKPYEEEKRTIDYKGGGQEELFLLLKKGTPYFYRGKVKTPFTPQKDSIAMVFREQAEKSKSKHLKDRTKQAESIAKKYKIKLQKCGENISTNGIFITSFPAKTTQKRKLEICQELDKEEALASAPIVYLSEKNASLLTNEIMVKFEDHVEKGEVEQIAEEFKLKIKRKLSALGNLYHFTTGNTATYEVLDISNKIAERENVIFSEPNLIHTVEEDAVVPTSFLFPEQWDHQILNTPDAWQFLRNINTNRTFGNSNVIIGVVDSGVDPTHPEFTGNVSDGSSKIYQAFDFVNMVANNNSISSDHGTACASAAAALANNPSGIAGVNEGVAGVAGNCRVLAIRRGGDEARYADMYLWAGGFDPESDLAGFPAQINPGADIITNSFGYSIGSSISGTMSAVFDKLADEGRNGLGTLLFFSAGNGTTQNPNGQDLDLTFYRPWGMYNKCFSIAASTLANDGVTEIKANYSSFGSVIEFCAPSNDGGADHNPPATYGAFTAIQTGNPLGDDDVTVGRPTAQNTLSANANLGVNNITLNNTAGFNAGQAIMLNNPGSGTAESHIITAVNNGTGQVTLDGNLFNSHTAGTNVFAAQADYTNRFGGTSHATPLCAGVAGLILSANPQLTWTQVRDLMRDTAVKINAGETNTITTRNDSTGAILGNTSGRWQDVNGNLSNAAAYNGTPFFSEFYGYGRIDAAAAVREAGWDIELVTTNLNFNDVPEGETAARAVRFNVRSLWSTNFNMTPPGAPFDTPLGTSESLGTSTDSSIVREVYLWVTYTGTTAGDLISMADGFTVTIQNPETEQEWVIPITANTISRPSSAIMLSLDQSGSMDFASGIGTSKRIDVLRFSANILADVIQEGNGLGIVSFDQDPHDILIPLVGPLGPVSPFDVDRANIRAAINSFSPNLGIGGSTAIGDGLERAQVRLTPVTGYDSKSVIVLTDGQETASKYISDVAASINDRVFAVGLGKAQNIEPSALNALVNNNDGYLLLTDELDNNSIFKLAKYFLQILAGVNNEDVVVDPDGELFAGQKHHIPFIINEADISTDVILMLPNPGMIDFSLESPNGHILSPQHSGTLPGLTFSYGNNVAFYRMAMPLPLGAGEREGKWTAILKVNEQYTGGYEGYYRAASSLENTFHAYPTSQYLQKRGIPYTLLVHAYSNLKMHVDLNQSGNEPGDNIMLNARLEQYGIPLDTKASVIAKVEFPNGMEKSLKLAEVDKGEYQLILPADTSGVYRFRVMASGTTFRGRPFTREQVRTGAVWPGGNIPVPGTDPGSNNEEDIFHRLCELMNCLLSEKNLSREFRAKMLKQGINIDGLLECLKKYCSGPVKPGLSSSILSKLKMNYSTLLATFKDVLDEQ